MKKIIRAVSVCSVLCMLLLQLSGCGIGASAGDLTAGLTPSANPSKPLNDTFYTAQTAFSLALFQQAAKEDPKDLLISPLSVSVALAMAANGAEGETAKEMLAVLGGKSKEELNANLQRWIEQLTAKENASMHLANSVWMREIEGLNVKHSFLQSNVDHFGAGVFSRPFDQKTVKEVNQWVKENTDGMIPSILQELYPETMMILLNALAFEAQWETPYDGSDVQEKTFTAIDGAKQAAKLMKSHESRYIEDANAIGFLRPYQNGEYSFGALLPREDITLENYIASLTAADFYETVSNPKRAVVTAYLPKFEKKWSYELSGILDELGMPLAFSDEADFSQMAEMPLHISAVQHKTYIKVDEKGTKAAAVTGIMTESDSVPEEPELKVEVRLDRPFVYFILDQKTNLPIFLGTVTSIE